MVCVRKVSEESECEESEFVRKVCEESECEGRLSVRRVSV